MVSLRYIDFQCGYTQKKRNLEGYVQGTLQINKTIVCALISLFNNFCVFFLLICDELLDISYTGECNKFQFVMFGQPHTHMCVITQIV